MGLGDLAGDGESEAYSLLGPRTVLAQVRGDLGPSFKYKDYRVAELIGRGLPVTSTMVGRACSST